LHHGAHRKDGDSDQKTLFSHVNNAFDQHRTLLPLWFEFNVTKHDQWLDSRVVMRT
jgi:hypothetical protein